ncbi:carbohydrate ABC transporter permease [Demequina lutea]|uniref:Alpha-glucoside transport system permease protein n=1 Tax=Demequina lutea TaxID=431489 RepID=A0A7Y9Z7R5_9MICO|nr:sugar ABC transporter permease [Demequina lutea]NYI40176.1 alpha-glucoside transport system permease protein [Demequina lutea]
MRPLMASSVVGDAASTLFGVIVAVAGFVAILGVVFFIAGRVTGRFQRPVAIVIALGPALFLLLLGLIIPALTTINNSLKNQQFLGQPNTKYIGLENYKYALTDPYTLQTILRSFVWLIVVPSITVIIGLAAALLLDRVKHNNLLKTLIFLPTAISFVGASVIWKYVYSYVAPSQTQTGLLSEVVMKLGWSNPPNWITSVPVNTFLLMIIMIWIQVGFAMVVLGAALQSIPDEIIESARLDGANGFSLFRTVQIPMIRNTVIVVLTTVMITTLKVFDIVFTMTNGNFNTDVLARQMYADMFVTSQVSRGSALAVILFIVVLPMMYFNIRQLRRERTER